jgi:hypothetical protein
MGVPATTSPPIFYRSSHKWRDSETGADTRDRVRAILAKGAAGRAGPGMVRIGASCPVQRFFSNA